MPAYSHAELSDRNLPGQHSIGSVTGLTDALSTLAVNDHETMGYAYDAMHASHSSIHHASVAVAEAAYIESLLQKFKNIESQEAEIARIAAEVQAHINTLQQALEAAAQHAADAKDSADRADGYKDKADELMGQVNVFIDRAAAVDDAKCSATRSAEEAAESAAQAQSYAQNAEMRSEQLDDITAKLAEVDNALVKAAEVATTANEAAAQAMSVLDRVNSIDEVYNTVLGAADRAEASANAAAETLAEVEDKLAYVTAAVDGVMRWKGVYDELPPVEGRMDGDTIVAAGAMYVLNEGAWVQAGLAPSDQSPVYVTDSRPLTQEDYDRIAAALIDSGFASVIEPTPGTDTEPETTGGDSDTNTEQPDGGE